MSAALQRMFQPPEWFDADQPQFMLDMYPELESKMRIYEMAGSLGVLESLGVLPEKVTDVFEFGSGVGEGLVALDMFADPRGAAVTGSEVTSERYKAAKVAEILFNVGDVVGNGNIHMESNPESFDLVVAQMFGSLNFEGKLTKDFISASMIALRVGGIAMVSSDVTTMRHFETIAIGTLQPAQFEVIDPSVLPSGLTHLPHIVLKK